MTEALNTRTDGYANRAEFEESPMQTTAAHLMRAYTRQPVSFVRGSGARLWDDLGVECLDAIVDVAVTSLGHAHPEIAAVIAEQAGALRHTSNVFRIDWQEQLGFERERLCALTGMESAFFCNSGAQANEPPSSWPRSPPRTTRPYDEEDEAGRIITRGRSAWHRKDLSDEWHRLCLTEDGAAPNAAVLPRWIALLSKRTENFTGALLWDV